MFRCCTTTYSKKLSVLMKLDNALMMNNRTCLISQRYEYIASAIMRGKSVGDFHKMAPVCIVDKSIPSSFVPQPTHPQTNVVI